MDIERTFKEKSDALKAYLRRIGMPMGRRGMGVGIPGEKLKQAVRDRDGQTCQYCLRTDRERLIIEHVVPRKLGGPSAAYNLVVACNICNAKKGKRVAVPFNLDKITESHPEWRAKVMAEASWECRYKCAIHSGF